MDSSTTEVALLAADPGTKAPRPAEGAEAWANILTLGSLNSWATQTFGSWQSRKRLIKRSKNWNVSLSWNEQPFNCFDSIAKTRLVFLEIKRQQQQQPRCCEFLLLLLFFSRSRRCLRRRRCVGLLLWTRWADLVQHPSQLIVPFVFLAPLSLSLFLTLSPALLSQSSCQSGNTSFCARQSLRSAHQTEVFRRASIQEKSSDQVLRIKKVTHVLVLMKHRWNEMKWNAVRLLYCTGVEKGLRVKKQESKKELWVKVRSWKSTFYKVQVKDSRS